MAKGSVLIKKYPDRRLYNTHASGYVTLEDIARLVREGREVRVVNAKNGKDITPVILTQIIVEDARERETALPLQLLRQLVRASDRTAHDFLSWYLDSTFDLYQKVKDARLPDAKAALSKPFDFVRGLLAGQPGPAAKSGAAGDEIQKLRRRVQQLEARLARQTPAARRTSPVRKRRARPS